VLHRLLLDCRHRLDRCRFADLTPAPLPAQVPDHRQAPQNPGPLLLLYSLRHRYWRRHRYLLHDHCPMRTQTTNLRLRRQEDRMN
jgi:hypothetical protein